MMLNAGVECRGGRRQQTAPLCSAAAAADLELNITTLLNLRGVVDRVCASQAQVKVKV